MQSIGSLISYYRQKKGLTQMQASKELGLDFCTLQKYEDDRKPIKMTIYAQMALLYEFDPLKDGVVINNKNFDINGGIYTVFKIHFAYIIKNEREKMLLFDDSYDDLPDGYFNKKFNKMLGEKVEKYKNIKDYGDIEEEYKNDKNKDVVKFIKTRNFK